MNTRVLARRLLAAAGSAALAVAGLGSAALAADTAAIDPQATATLTIHKLANTGQTGPTSGTEQQVPGAVPIEHVTFRICKVAQADLSTPEGWTIAEGFANQSLTVEGDKVTLAPSSASHALTDCQDATTDEQGTTTREGRPALYVVQEIDATKARIAGQTATVISTAAPFAVTIPMDNLADHTWNYRVHVYPKNTVGSAPVKTVSAPTAITGRLDWAVAQKLPAFDEANPLTSFQLVDDLAQAGDLANVLATVKVKVDDKDRTSDFAVSLVDERKLTITAKNPGALPSGASIVTTYSTVGSQEAQTNSVTAYIDDAVIGTATARGPLNKVMLTKKNEAGALLKGAEFELCATRVDGVSDAQACTSATATDDQGVLVIDRLKPGTYTLKETKAPAGYQRVADMEVTVTDDRTPVQIEVVDPKVQVPTLPVTGADGQLLMTVTGMALALLAGGVVLVTRRRATVGD
ncbi:SpaH/EbpB family LPXTG-anchored major pilin [Actinomyces sp. B33]|uniref:SpaH/EbpB family LPXTG-anchored major pilin n=1 Tax=Actinomyces sp. B33 TaxID=2942131 RepID=UPI002341C983|nr:SpaH/EbpB family LPXTG-anchored major pilin [Actinomyces sp. B33]MDC4232154.1 SpaH/EbpB family LPXTG-anchored major pilin [Actinomyces sp. B33]